ncbi:MAG: CRISPR-associated protein Cas4 [Armatimonadetes bacterium]|nr:CRISPR-associated protein Cas4 [Armatimonadota bacterium]
MITDLVNISDLNQFLYCPSRLYYLMFFKTQEINVHLADGRGMHARQGRRGGWYREVYLRSEHLGLHGRVDLIDMRNGAAPVERKRGYAYYENDLVQLAAYAMLLEEHLNEPVFIGYLYLYGTNKRHPIEITEQLRQKVMVTVSNIRAMEIDKVPIFCENPRKCEKCSVVGYCMPYEARVLEEV